MAKPKFVTDGDTPLKLNWVVRFTKEMIGLELERAYKVIGITVEDSLAVIVPFSEIKDATFMNVRYRKSVYKKLALSVPIHIKAKVYGTHLDNLTKEEIAKEKSATAKYEKAELIRNLGLSAKLEETIIRIIQDYESSLHMDMMKRFDETLAKLKVDGINYRGEFKELTMSEIAIKRLQNISKEGWQFCFEVNGKYYFQRPRLKKTK